MTVALVAALLSTALSHPTRLVPLDEVTEPLYSFEDMRDPALDKSKSESPPITNCAYGAVRIGKRDFARTRRSMCIPCWQTASGHD